MLKNIFHSQLDARILCQLLIYVFLNNFMKNVDMEVVHEYKWDEI